MHEIIPTKDIIPSEITKLKQQIKHLQQQKIDHQHVIQQLNKEIQTFQTSTSWRITKPLRQLAILMKKFNRLVLFYKNYKQIHPRLKGYARLIYKSFYALTIGGIQKLQNDIVMSERNLLAQSLTNQLLSYRSDEIFDVSILNTFQLILKIRPPIIFDHNQGGGTNVYTKTLIKQATFNGNFVLRVYPSNNAWFIQLIGSNNDVLFKTSNIETLFSYLYQSQSNNIIINSLYGHPDINLSVQHIITLTQNLNAALDFKVNDFNALCPSPHLLNFENQYCGIPSDKETCKKCLKKNQDWYHDWYPEENKTTDIQKWRAPFQLILNIATDITFFDPSSVEIMRKVFDINDSKIRVVPHTNEYFKCNQDINLQGPLHIGILGHLTKVKGYDVVKKLAEFIQQNELKIPITVIGSGINEYNSNINIYGQYTHNELPNIIVKKGINVILMASIIPETFSYTLSEAIEMKLPIVTFDIGAQGNRIKQYEYGKVIPLDATSEVILMAIQSILKSTQERRN